MTSGTKLICLELAYDGTSYHGWQSQSDGSGIQDAVERCLKTVLRVPVRLTSSSRTDTGVHAEHQVVTFWSPPDLNENFNPGRLVKSLNALLPTSIRVRSAREVSAKFHPIRSAVAKVYRYRIWRSPGLTPFVEPYVWKWNGPLDLPRMQSAAAQFVGTHDFTSFCASDSTASTRTRQLYDVKLISEGPLLDIWFIGEGFLKQMVRNLVGTLMAVGQGKLRPEDMPRLFAALDRRVVPATAPACGLSLVRVCYDEVPTLDALLGEARKGYNLPLIGEWIDV